MDDFGKRTDGQAELTRRSFLKLGVAGALGSGTSFAFGGHAEDNSVLEEAIRTLEYLTPPEKFREFGREKPRIDELPPERLREVGLHRDTWQLEVLPDPESDCIVEQPLSKKAGTALTWEGLMKLAEKRAVRFLMVLTCTNMAEPIGMGLWEGVPLREVIWMSRPKGNIRRVYYWGYHNDDPKQRFQSSVPVGRVLEDPPGELPVILCYKLNGRWLSSKGGGPVRLVLPGAYGNKSVKWVQSVVLTNDYRANDTYALWNNDIDTTMKSQARFINPPKEARAGQPLPLVGFAQVGMSGLSKVQYSLSLEERPLPAEDSDLTASGWNDARILPPPENWGGGLQEGKLPAIPLRFDPKTGRPRSWPLRYTIVHWAAPFTAPAAGSYRLRCRTIDANGIAQPMPRPFPKAGNNAIHEVQLVVKG